MNVEVFVRHANGSSLDSRSDERCDRSLARRLAQSTVPVCEDARACAGLDVVARVTFTAVCAEHNSDADAAGMTSYVAVQAEARASAPAAVNDFVEARVWKTRVRSREWSRTDVLM